MFTERWRALKARNPLMASFDSHPLTGGLYSAITPPLMYSIYRFNETPASDASQIPYANPALCGLVQTSRCSLAAPTDTSNHLLGPFKKKPKIQSFRGIQMGDVRLRWLNSYVLVAHST